LNNTENYGSNLTGSKTRVLLHNNKSKSLNSHNFLITDSTSNTAIRNVTNTDKDKLCNSCAVSATSAPVLIKLEVDPNASETNVLQSWHKSISYYSVGAGLSDSDQAYLNNAYKTFAAAVGRTVTD